MGQQFNIDLPDDGGGGVNVEPSPGLDPNAAIDMPVDVPPISSAPIPIPSGPPAGVGGPGDLGGPLALVASALASSAARPSVPIPPQAPPPPGNLQRVISTALLGLAAGLGPNHGGAGVSNGLLIGAHANELARQAKYENDVRLYHEQQQEANRQQAVQTQMQAAQEQRQQQRARMLLDIQKALPALKTKEAYDRFMDQTGALLVQSGYRDLSPVMLRSQFKFQPPDAIPTIEATLKKYFDNDVVKQRLKDSDFSSLSNDSITPPGLQKMTVLDALKITGMDIQLDGGTSIPLEKLSEGQAAIVAAKQEFFHDTGRKPTRDDDAAVYKRARAMMQNKDPEMTDLTKELARQRLADARTKNATTIEIADGSPDYRRAQDVAFGRLTLSQLKGLYSFRDREKMRAVLDKAESLNPSFNAALFEQGYKFSSNPKTQMAMASIASVEPNIDRLIRLSDQWDRTRFPTLNGWLKAMRFQWGDRTVTNLEQLQTIVGDELGTALGSGSASDLKVKLGLDLAGGNVGPENFRSTLTEVKDALTNRKRGLLGQMGPYGNQAPAAPAGPAAPLVNPFRKP